MIGSLRGKLLVKRSPDVVIEANGVGYQVSVPMGTLTELPEEGREAFLHIHTHVREDALQLYGFSTEEEKRMFLGLLNVSGIGPKVALSVVSALSTEDFLRALETEDIAALSRVPGVGKKTAQRMVLELRGKLTPVGVRDKAFEDTLSALLNLGYRRSDAAQSVELAQAKGFNDVESLIRESLRRLSGGAHEKD